jgi:hypothetical protein
MMTAGAEHITAYEFKEWLAKARPGERITYCTGFLVCAIYDARLREDPNAGALGSLQTATWNARDKVHLMQRRAGGTRFEYIAQIKRNGLRA